MHDRQQHDVIVLGGGLAGLSLAIQLQQRHPQMRILVLERRAHPVPLAAHKVGESTVEIGADYFDTVLNLKEHLMQHQLKKFGFRFFFCDRREDIDRTLELGASTFLPTPAYQIDRGIFENFLGEHARALGVHFLDGSTVRAIELREGVEEHSVTYSNGETAHTAAARWVIDASGRAGLLKRKLDLAQDNAHDANAVWFRIADRLDVNDWSHDEAWLKRCDPPRRWLSTNHLCGEGYWVWLIPLASGSHSVGIVCDAQTHPLETMNSFDKALDWLKVHQPRLAREVEDRRHLIQDFRFLRDFSYGCRQVFSGADRWALTGEAGVFLDPFYSPGSDFIAIANTYIVDLIERDLAGERIEGRAHVYQQLYYSFYESTLTLYTQQYGIFGHPEVMSAKVVWDYTYYWGILCQFFFQRRLTDLASFSALSAELKRVRELNEKMQTLLRQWATRSERSSPAAMLDQASWPWFARLNAGLRDELSEQAFHARIREHTRVLEQLAAEIVARAGDQVADLDVSDFASLPAVPAEGQLLFSKLA